MMRFQCWQPIVVLAVAATVGCTNGGQTVQPPGYGVPTAQAGAAPQATTLAAQPANPQYQQQIAGLDKTNIQLHSEIAELQRLVRLRDEQIVAMRTQLNSTADALASIRNEKTQLEEQYQTVSATLQQRGGVTIKPNNSLRTSMPELRIDGLNVRRDGDVIRVELPADKLFAQGSYQLLPNAPRLVDQAATEIRRLYGNHIIGVEGHTDSRPASAGMIAHNHQLSVTQALAVFDLMHTRGHFAREQLMLVGHGGTHPVVSNATAAGQARNRRVELVIYPDTYSGR